MNSEAKERTETWIVYEKTAQGQEEIQTRKLNLPQKLRTLLIVVDGQKTLGHIVNQFSPMGNVAELLSELDKKGLIAKRGDVYAPGTFSPDETLRRMNLAKNFMVNTVTDAVGPMGSSLIETLKNCDTLSELRRHFDNYLYVISSGRGKSTAKEYEAELAKLFQ